MLRQSPGSPLRRNNTNSNEGGSNELRKKIVKNKINHKVNKFKITINSTKAYHDNECLEGFLTASCNLEEVHILIVVIIVIILILIIIIAIKHTCNTIQNELYMQHITYSMIQNLI